MSDTAHLLVEFFVEPRENKNKTAIEKRPIFEDVEFVKIRAAGDPKTVFVAPANDQSSQRDPFTNQKLTYKQAHPGPYEAFKAGVEYVGTGTPLKEAQFITTSKAKELAALNIMTVEALAELEGEKLGRLGMGGRDLKNEAIDYLQKASGSVQISELQAENAALLARMEALEAAANAVEPAPEVEPETEEQHGGSPFADWAAPTLRLWIEEQGGEVNVNWTTKKLIAEADKLNKQLQQGEAA